MKKIISIIAVLLAFSCEIVAQNYPRKEIEIGQFIDDLFAMQDQDNNTNYQDLYEALYQLYLEPLNLNTASREELQGLFILTEAQINALMRHISKNGKLLSIYELQTIEGYDLALINKIIPFVNIEDAGNIDARPLWKRIISEKNNYLLMRVEQNPQTQVGYKPTTLADTNTLGNLPQRYAGSPQQIYGRFRVSKARDFSFGLTAEKDAGERVVWNPTKRQYGMDFYSYHAFFQNKGRFKAIALGDFQLQIGQSLMFAAGFNVGKGGETINTIRRANIGLKPYTSVLETNFFRGAGVTYNLLKNKKGELDITAFFSRNFRDGNVQAQLDTTDINTDENFVSSFQLSGLHRTAPELNARKSIGERVLGTNLGFTTADQRTQIGLSFVHTTLDAPILRTPSGYNQFEFNGKENYNIGMNANHSWQNFNFFGEIVRSKSGGIGYNAGFLASLTPKMEAAMLFRGFDKNYHSFYGSSLNENSRDINERGIYLGLKYTPIRKVVIAVYYDKFLFPWLRYKVDAPSDGHEYLAKITYSPTRKISMFVQFRKEFKQENFPENTTQINYLTERVRTNFVFNLDYRAEEILSLKSRVQFSSYEIAGKQTSGFILLQDINLKFRKLEISTRIALFDVDDFNNRQYTYEKNVLYAFSIPALQDRGTRNYILLEYQFNKRYTIWARYARTNVINKKSVGSGLEATPTNTQEDLKFQLRIIF